MHYICVQLSKRQKKTGHCLTDIYFAERISLLVFNVNLVYLVNQLLVLFSLILCTKLSTTQNALLILRIVLSYPGRLNGA